MHAIDAIQRKRTDTSEFWIFSLVSKAHNWCPQLQPTGDLLMEILSLEVQQPFLICEFTNWPQGWKKMLPAKQEDGKCPRSDALCAHLCLGIQELGRTCSLPRLCGNEPAAPWKAPADVGCSVWMCVSPPTAIDLLYWRDIKQTGIVFGSFLLLLFLTQFSVVSVSTTWSSLRSQPPVSASTSLFYKLCRKNRRGSPFKCECPTRPALAPPLTWLFPRLYFTACALWVLLLLTFNRPLRVSFNAVFNIKYFC